MKKLACVNKLLCKLGHTLTNVKDVMGNNLKN